MMNKNSTARRFARARQARAISNQELFESLRTDFGRKACLGNFANVIADRREIGRQAIEAGEGRIAEVAGTEFEQGWRDAVASFASRFAEWEASHSN